jgi:hypothetical protein
VKSTQPLNTPMRSSELVFCAKEAGGMLEV